MSSRLYIRSLANAPAGRAPVAINQKVMECRTVGWKQVIVSLDSRLYEPDSARILHRLAALTDEQRVSIEVVDVGTFSGRLRALANKVNHTPVLEMDGQRFEGVKEIEAALI